MTEATGDITFHYPPELFNLLVDTIPLLNRSKKDVLLFFRGAGVTSVMLGDLEQRLKTTPKEINKYEITRTVLDRLNARGEATLRQRREVLRRVVEFTNFDSCWTEDKLKAKGLIASIREVVNQKDAFTRINQEREKERQARLAQAQEAAGAKQERLAKIDAAKGEFYSLFATGLTPSERGKKLEWALNNLFHAYGILVQEAFHVVGTAGEGIIEQIDGVIGLQGALYFVEMKWYKAPVGRAEISEHLVRLMSRAEARGIFISASDYTEPAVTTARDFLQHKLIAFVHLEEIVRVLETQAELATYLEEKINAAQIHKNPYFKPLTSSGARSA
ncbi:restriction endonuclease [Thiocystis violacea]|uniref:restriction endonuclease n=1 Tax=Thiocystis violacea TaxID=13725 RepID=UPI001903CB31|nr:restriction endonuclease [Thiocystis violacea]MBK1724147.1 restriction endonuclease [Thiocystis violacea]